MNFFWKIKRIIKWFPVLWKDEPWDYCFLIKLICFKIKDMYKFNSGKYAVARHPKKELRQMLEVISHFEHYLDIYEYCDFSKNNFEWEELFNGSYKLKSLKRDRIRTKKINELEKWHFKEAFRKMAKYMTKWWD